MTFSVGSIHYSASSPPSSSVPSFPSSSPSSLTVSKSSECNVADEILTRRGRWDRWTKSVGTRCRADLLGVVRGRGLVSHQKVYETKTSFFGHRTPTHLNLKSCGVSLDLEKLDLPLDLLLSPSLL